jgi:hypothetical protein
VEQVVAVLTVGTGKGGSGRRVCELPRHRASSW